VDRDFLHPPRPPLGPTSLLYNGYTDISGGAVAESWRRPPTPSSASVKKSAAIILLSLWAFLASSGVDFTFTFIYLVSVQVFGPQRTVICGVGERMFVCKAAGTVSYWKQPTVTSFTTSRRPTRGIEVRIHSFINQ